MTRDTERIRRVQTALAGERLDALVMSLPENVRMVSGYWPVTGTALAIATQDGRVGIAVPEEERELAERGWADEIRTFRSNSLEELTALLESVGKALGQIAAALNLRGGCIVGYNREPGFQPASYPVIYVYGPVIREMLLGAIPSATLRPASDTIGRLRSVLTAAELSCARKACAIAGEAFTAAAGELREGVHEHEAAAALALPLFKETSDERHGGTAFCMSGPNSAQAKAPHLVTRSRRIEQGDLAMLHVNSYVDGIWTDLTRTFSIGEPDERRGELYRAVLAASRQAVRIIRPGIRAADVDACVRSVLDAHGLGDAFPHGAGHGVGFSAIDHAAIPRLHPKSPDVLEAGMLFTLETAVYFEGYGGVRHGDVVTVNETGAELLTPFLNRTDQLVC